MAKLRRRLRVPGDLQQMRTAMQFVKEVAQDAGVGDDGIFQIELSVEEVFTNIVEHGYRYNGADKSVEILCEADGETLWIAIGDEAPPFNPLQQPESDPLASLEDRDTGGWGIAFVRRYMDKLHYHYSNQRNWLILEKKIS
ncbi:MAG: ATP-binding protein [Anaerolineae bacterium]|nr:ATP-binding protein [Anaerolineae bacterium]